ncbi:MAG: hypothetical protein GYA66_05875 [Phyllobacteriaceae bacterium]|jgi:hypothetical protein|nr:hypothetical protein [Phyllobacteriaceae bacterium]
MNLKLVASLAFATLLTAGAVFAQSAPAELVTAYKAGVAAAKCELGLDPAKESQIGDAVQRIEQKSGLAQAELDALWASTQADQAADSAGFCGTSADAIDKTIAAAN